MSQANVGNRLGVLAGLETLATSSEYKQAAELAGRYGRGHDAAMPREELAGIAERASLTGLREDLSAGIDAEQAVRNAGGLLGAWGFARKTPALSAIGNAIGAGADLSTFMRTGDPASLGAAGFGALGAAAGVTAAVASGPIAVGAAVVGGLALGGKFITRQMAGDNEYHAAIDGPMAQTHRLSDEQTQALMGREARMLAAAGLGSEDLAQLARTDSLDEAMGLMSSGTPLDTGVYGDAIDPAELDARVRALEQQQPGRRDWAPPLARPNTSSGRSNAWSCPSSRRRASVASMRPSSSAFTVDVTAFTRPWPMRGEGASRTRMRRSTRATSPARAASTASSTSDDSRSDARAFTASSSPADAGAAETRCSAGTRASSERVSSTFTAGLASRPSDHAVSSAHPSASGDSTNASFRSPTGLLHYGVVAAGLSTVEIGESRAQPPGRAT